MCLGVALMLTWFAGAFVGAGPGAGEHRARGWTQMVDSDGNGDGDGDGGRQRRTATGAWGGEWGVSGSGGLVVSSAELVGLRASLLAIGSEFRD